VNKIDRELINKAIDVMEKVKIGSLIRLHDLHNFRVIRQEPSWKEINHFGTPSDHVIRMINETIPNAMTWTKSRSIERLRIELVQHAVEGLLDNIELIEG